MFTLFNTDCNRDEAERRKAAQAWLDGDKDMWSRYTAPVGLEVLGARGYKNARALVSD